MLSARQANATGLLGEWPEMALSGMDFTRLSGFLETGIMPEPVNHNAAHPVQRHVFVYGTLRRGDDNDITRLHPPPRYVGPGGVQGTMYHLGAYPGVVLAQPGGVLSAGGPRTVVGEVYAIEPELERALDEIEELYPQQKDEYVKRQIPVFVGHECFQCIVYEINPVYIMGKPTIPGGDWVKGRHSLPDQSV